MRARRRAGLATWCAALLSALAPSASIAQAPPTTSFDVDGLRVVHRRTSGDIVAVRLYLLGGSRQLEEYPEGIEALVLRTMNAEAEARLESVGARARSYVNRDWSMDGFVTLAPTFGDAWDVWAANVTDPTLSPMAVNASRLALLSDARQRFADPDSRVRWLAWQTIFRDHPYRFDPRGTVEGVRGINSAAARGYWQNEFVKSRMLLVVVGDVPREEVAARVSESLAKLPVGSYVWDPRAEVEKFANSWRVEGRDLPTSYMQGFILGPPPGDENYFTFEVATNLLSGRLNSVIRNDKSLSYAVYASFEEAAVPTATLYASSPSPAQAYRLVIEQLEWLQDLNRVPGWVLGEYLDQFYVDQLSQNLTADGQADALARAQILFGSYELADHYFEGIHDVSPSEIRRVARNYMRAVQMAYLGNPALMQTEW